MGFVAKAADPVFTVLTRYVAAGSLSSALPHSKFSQSYSHKVISRPAVAFDLVSLKDVVVSGEHAQSEYLVDWI